MALFERLKRGSSSEKQRVAEGALSDDAADSSPAPSVRGKAGITETVKQDRVMQLAPREYELYLLLLEGYTLNESAKKLCVKYAMANTHMNAIYRKLGVNSRAELIINYHTVMGQKHTVET